MLLAGCWEGARGAWGLVPVLRALSVLIQWLQPEVHKALWTPGQASRTPQPPVVPKDLGHKVKAHVFPSDIKGSGRGASHLGQASCKEVADTALISFLPSREQNPNLLFHPSGHYILMVQVQAGEQWHCWIRFIHLKKGVQVLWGIWGGSDACL